MMKIEKLINLVLFVCLCLLNIKSIYAQADYPEMPKVVLSDDSLNNFSAHFIYNTYHLTEDTLVHKYFDSHFYSAFHSLSAQAEQFHMITTKFSLLCDKKTNLPYTGIIVFSDKTEFICLNGLLTGLDVTYDSSGNISRSSYYINDLEFGLFTKYNKNGTIDYLNTYLLGQKCGYSIGFYDNGSKKSEGLYNIFGQYLIKDAKIGYWTEYYANGRKKSEGKWGIMRGHPSSFGDHPGSNTEIGVWNYYDENGVLKKSYDYGERGVISLAEYPSPKTITLTLECDTVPKPEPQHSDYRNVTEYFYSKKTVVDSISIPIPHWLQTVAYDSIRSKEICCLFEKSNNIPFTGKLMICYPCGALYSESYYENGVRCGISITYYKDKTIKSTSCYLAGFRYGTHTDYNTNGSIQSVTAYEWESHVFGLQ